ncbi:hypothetical protein SAMN05216252_13835 [Actinacidiphila glaucinigra]|uniref:Uncharacterized protein n=1 Tax=Actinacidiphila glaucinigra TaxID=235986 RepID=A0A239NJ02_9ACTN|nr:hypothetical protein SAMN05216252_13835 [Actinacidiphila glaucinigra]
MTAPPRLAAPRRNRPGLLAQFVLQWFWLPVWAAVALALGLLVALASAGFNPPLAWLNPWRAVLTWPRFRLEWAGDPARWDAYATERIRARIADAERRPAAHRAHGADGAAVLAVTVPARLFRGVGPDRAAAVAEGWTAEVRGTGRDRWSPGALSLRRPLPQPGR